MSGVVKAVGKAFKKVGSVVKKVALPALAIGAVVFTGGAALGALPAFGTAVSGGLGALGITGSLGTVLSSAVTQAGFGAAAGGILGGSKGLKTGALLGGALGGLSGAANAGLLGSGGLPGAGTGINPNAPTPSPSGLPSGTAAGGGTSTTTVANPGGGGLLGFANRNPVIAGSLISGVGQGITANAQEKSLSKRERERQERIEDNFRVSGGLLTQAQADTVSRPSPQDRFRRPGQFIFDREAGRIVFQEA